MPEPITLFACRHCGQPVTLRDLAGEWGGQIVSIPTDKEASRMNPRFTDDLDMLESKVSDLLHWLSDNINREAERWDRTDTRALCKTRPEAPHTRGNYAPAIALALAANDRIATAQARFRQSMETLLGQALLQRLRQAGDPRTPHTPAPTPSDPDHNAGQKSGHDESPLLPGNGDA